MMRSGWGDGARPYADEHWGVFDCGPLGDGGHGHYDHLAVELWGGGHAARARRRSLHLRRRRRRLAATGSRAPRPTTRCASTGSTRPPTGRASRRVRRRRPGLAHVASRGGATSMPSSAARPSPRYDAVHTRDASRSSAATAGSSTTACARRLDPRLRGAVAPRAGAAGHRRRSPTRGDDHVVEAAGVRLTVPRDVRRGDDRGRLDLTVVRRQARGAGRRRAGPRARRRPRDADRGGVVTTLAERPARRRSGGAAARRPARSGDRARCRSTPAVDVVRCKYRVGESLRVLYRCATADGERLVTCERRPAARLRWWTFPDDRRLPRRRRAARAVARDWSRWPEVGRGRAARSPSTRPNDRSPCAPSTPTVGDRLRQAVRGGRAGRRACSPPATPTSPGHPADRRCRGRSAGRPTRACWSSRPMPGTRMGRRRPGGCDRPASAMGRAIAALHGVPRAGRHATVRAARARAGSSGAGAGARGARARRRGARSAISLGGSPRAASPDAAGAAPRRLPSEERHRRRRPADAHRPRPGGPRRRGGRHRQPARPGPRRRHRRRHDAATGASARRCVPRRLRVAAAAARREIACAGTPPPRSSSSRPLRAVNRVRARRARPAPRRTRRRRRPPAAERADEAAPALPLPALARASATSSARSPSPAGSPSTPTSRCSTAGGCPPGTVVPPGVELVDLPSLGHDDAHRLVSHEAGPHRRARCRTTRRRIGARRVPPASSRRGRRRAVPVRPAQVRVRAAAAARRRAASSTATARRVERARHPRRPAATRPATTTASSSSPTATSTPCSCTATPLSPGSRSRSGRRRRSRSRCTTPASSSRPRPAGTRRRAARRRRVLVSAGGGMVGEDAAHRRRRRGARAVRPHRSDDDARRRSVPSRRRRARAARAGGAASTRRSSTGSTTCAVRSAAPSCR